MAKYYKASQLNLIVWFLYSFITQLYKITTKIEEYKKVVSWTKVRPQKSKNIKKLCLEQKSDLNQDTEMNQAIFTEEGAQILDFLNIPAIQWRQSHHTRQLHACKLLSIAFHLVHKQHNHNLNHACPIGSHPQSQWRKGSTFDTSTTGLLTSLPVETLQRMLLVTSFTLEEEVEKIKEWLGWRWAELQMGNKEEFAEALREAIASMVAN